MLPGQGGGLASAASLISGALAVGRGEVVRIFLAVRWGACLWPPVGLVYVRNITPLAKRKEKKILIFFNEVKNGKRKIGL